MLRPLLLPRADRYFALRFLVMSLLCFLALTALVVVADIFQQVDEFQRYAKESERSTWVVLWLVIQHYATFAPLLVVQLLLPLVLLIAATLVVTQAGAANEFTVLRASGISLQRATVPFLVVALAMGYLLYMTRDLYVPFLVRKNHEINNTIRPSSVKPISMALRDGKGQVHFMSMGHFDSAKGVARNLRLEVRALRQGENVNEMMKWQLYAAKSVELQPRVAPETEAEGETEPPPNQWRPVAEGKHILFTLHRIDEQPWRTPLPTFVTRAMLERHTLGMGVMSSSDLAHLSDDLDVRIERERRRTDPWMPPLLLLVTLPLVMGSLARGQHPNYVINIVLGVVTSLVFYLLRLKCLNMGLSEDLPPMVAAWLPHVIFLCVGGWLFWRLER